MTLSVLPLILGTVVMLGWGFDLEALKRIYPTWVSMKFNTALCFVLLGGVLVSRSLDERWGDFGMSRVTCALSLLVFVLVSLWATIAGGGQFINELFISDSVPLAQTVTPGQPSTATLVAFILGAVAGLPYRSQICNGCGAAMILIGSSAVMGYLIGAPEMYFATTKSTAMAMHTALGFIAAGAAYVAERD